jgi:hypothetical protein
MSVRCSQMHARSQVYDNINYSTLLLSTCMEILCFELALHKTNKIK